LASSLNIGRIHAAYGAVRVIEDVSLTIGGGETVVLLGTNGNGKSTLMKCIMGMVRPSQGSIVAEIDGVHHDLVGRTTEEIVDLGIALVPAGRRLFPKLTVEANLMLGASRRTARRAAGREAPSSRFSSTVSLGNSRRPSGTSAMPRSAICSVARPTRSWWTPSISATIDPALGRTIPMMHFISVDLPLPLVPSSTTVSPAPTLNETSSITRTAP